jgi:hypothetical protein
MTSGDASAAAMNNQINSYGWTGVWWVTQHHAESIRKRYQPIELVDIPTKRLGTASSCLRRAAALAGLGLELWGWKSVLA